ncbi:MAG: hypothetical protein REI64_12380 [Pedobacter sp.]|uniref:hypothetical protein n=1 Tax=Pedobacter sp. TaxID=1411316 RepID=UPI002806EBD9|nr:hypothetical protein [Pedobacter sp.]MDQ8005591.1 hypothetical protein [Pedobacter sp.]
MFFSTSLSEPNPIEAEYFLVAGLKPYRFVWHGVEQTYKVCEWAEQKDYSEKRG